MGGLRGRKEWVVGGSSAVAGGAELQECVCCMLMCICVCDEDGVGGVGDDAQLGVTAGIRCSDIGSNRRHNNLQPVQPYLYSAVQPAQSVFRAFPGNLT